MVDGIMRSFAFGLVFTGAYRVVVDEPVLLVLGAGDGLIQALDHGPVTGVLHVVLCLGQQQLARRGVQVLLASIL